ncbi:MAG: hypothetical protein ACOX5G_08135 [Kiritimatiellia bacterium]|jgi:hypothetical protein
MPKGRKAATTMPRGRKPATVYTVTSTEVYTGNKLLDYIKTKLYEKFTTEEEKRLVRCILAIVKVGINTTTKKADKATSLAKKRTAKKAAPEAAAE